MPFMQLAYNMGAAGMAMYIHVEGMLSHAEPLCDTRQDAYAETAIVDCFCT